MPQDFSKMSDAELESFISSAAPKSSAPSKDMSKVSDADLEAIIKSYGPEKSFNRGAAAVEGFGQGLTMGYTPQINALAEKPATGLLNAIASSKLGAKMLDVPQNPNVQADDYTQARDYYANRTAQLAKDNPGTYGAAAFGGGLISAFAMPGGKVFQGAGKLAKLGNAAVMGAGQGFVANPGETTGEISPLQLGARVGNAELGAGLGVGLTALPMIPGAIAAGGKKLMSAVLGPSTQAIDKYLQNPEAIRGAKSVEEIKNLLDKSVQHLFDDVEKSKLSRDQAKEALKAIEDQIKDTSRDGAFQFKIKQADLKESFREAKDVLENKFKGEIDSLKNIKSPVHMADDVQTAIQDLKQQIVKGSQESYAILDKDPQAYGVRNAAPILRKMADDMNIQAFDKSKTGILAGAKDIAARTNFSEPVGQASKPVTSQSIGVQNELRKFAALLEQTPQKVPARELKKILQQIDNSEKALYGQPGFDSRVSQAYKMVRATIDDAIKVANPEYREKMAEVAEKTGLLNKAIERFGDPRATVSRLNSINSRTAGEDRKILEALGGKTGGDFMSPVDAFSEAQSKLKYPDAIKQGLKSGSKIDEIEAQLGQLSRPESQPEFIKDVIAKSGLPEKQAQAGEGLSAAINKLKGAEENLQPFKSLGPFSTQNAVKGLMKPAGKENIELRRTMENLSKITGQDFNKMIQDRGVADAFKGEFRIGSRNVNLLGVLGGLASGGMGVGAGVVGGALVDRFGPQMAQKILDGVIHMQGSPTVQKIGALSIPDDAKQYLIKTLINQQVTVDPIERRMEQLQNQGR